MKPKIDLKASILDIREAMVSTNKETKGEYVDDWSENLENLAGKLVSSTKGAMRSLASGEWAEQLGSDGNYGSVTVANRIAPAFNRLAGRTLGMFNGFQVIPGTSEAQDKDAAAACEKIATALWYSDGIYQHCIECLGHSVCSGHGFSLNEGDPTLDQPQRIGDVDVPVGRVIRRVIPSQNLNVFPGIRVLEDSPVVHAVMGYTVEEIERRWGPVPDSAPAFDYDGDRLNVLEPGLKGQLVKVDRFWFKPDVKLWPLGKQYVVIGDNVLWESTDWIGVGNRERPRTCMVPIVDFSDLPTHLGFWGRGPQTVARAPQKILNVAWSKMSQVAALPGLVIGVPRGSEISTTKITNAPVSIIKFNPAGGHGITFWTPPRMQMYEYVVQMCSQWIDEAFSQPPASRGMSPGSRFPAAGLQLLMEQADLGDTPYGKSLMDSVSKLMRLTLLECQRVCPDEMVDYIVGANGRFERVAFRKAELKDGWDCRALPDSGLPPSKSGRIDAVAKLGQMGFLGNLQMDPEAQRKARKLAKVLTDDDAFDPEKADECNAKDEEKLFVSGVSAPIQQYDDHETHMRIHLQEAKERGHLGRDQNPDVVARYQIEEEARLAHMEAHMEAAQPQQPAPEPGMDQITPDQMPAEGIPQEGMPTEEEAMQAAMEAGPEDEFIDDSPVPGEEPVEGA